jgi:hypothetical protein
VHVTYMGKKGNAQGLVGGLKREYILEDIGEVGG